MSKDLDHASPWAIEVERASVRYGPATHAVLEDFSFQFRRGCIYVLLGPNGCGKSTLLMALCGIVSLSAGRVTFGVGEDGPVGTVEYIPQNYREALFPWKTVAANVAFWARSNDEGVAKACCRALDLTELLPFANRFPRELSGGQQQLVLLARAAAAVQPILILDEPFSAIDIARRVRMVDCLKDEWHGKGKTVICTVHEAELAAALADEIVIMGGPPLKKQSVIAGVGQGSEGKVAQAILDDIRSSFRAATGGWKA
jgi:NitT/TauT family transport system ATP-binding protein